MTDGMAVRWACRGWGLGLVYYCGSGERLAPDAGGVGILLVTLTIDPLTFHHPSLSFLVPAHAGARLSFPS